MTEGYLQAVPTAPGLPRSLSTVLIAAARCWQAAHDGHELAQPRLARLLAGYDGVMLAPVLDSMMTFVEIDLGRSFVPGMQMRLSDDELMLLDLVYAAEPPAWADRRRESASALDCALASTRVMLASVIDAERVEAAGSPARPASAFLF